MTVDVQETPDRAREAADESEAAPSDRQWPALNELLLACLGLAVVGTLAYARHLIHGGFYMDDWADAAGTFDPPNGPSVGHALSYFAGVFSYRPVLIIYVPLRYYLLGANIGLQLAWAVALAVVVAALLYGILRIFGVPWYHAWVIGALTIVFPWFDSTRLWETTGVSSLVVALVLAGLWLAMVGLTRRSWLLHSFAAVLYLISILAYEITLPLIAVAGVLYVLHAGWRIGRARWGVDLAVVLVAGLWVGLHTDRSVSGASGDLHHLGEIILGGGTILGRTLFPVGAHSETIPMLAILAVVLGLGLAVYLASPASGRELARWQLREWLLLAVAGLVVAAFGWVMFIPADPYYTPSVFGMTNRVNAVAGFGLVIAVYATLGVGTALVARVVPMVRRWAPLVTVVLGLMLGAAYVHVLERHIGIWDAAFRAETATITKMKSKFPRLPHGTTVFTSNFPAYQTLGVPIFASTWDLNGMVKMEYSDWTLSAYPMIQGLKLTCQADGVDLHGAGALPEVPYGRARLLDLQTGRHSDPHTRRECLAVAGSYSPGPLYLSTAY